MFAPGPLDGLFAGTDSSPGDSTNWDFLQGLEFDSGPDVLSLPVSRPRPTSNERLKEKNRKAQQRARQKKKVGGVSCAGSPWVRLKVLSEMLRLSGTCSNRRSSAC